MGVSVAIVPPKIVFVLSILGSDFVHCSTKIGQGAGFILDGRKRAGGGGRKDSNQPRLHAGGMHVILHLGCHVMGIGMTASLQFN
jgi:hypothetical protein